MDKAESLIAIITTGVLFAPLLTALINNPKWSGTVKQVVAVVVSVALAVGAIALNKGFASGVDVTESILLVIGLSTFAFKALWQPTGVASTLENVGTTDPSTTT